MKRDAAAVLRHLAGAASIVITAAGIAHAADIPILAQPLVHTRAGTTEGCGARLTGGAVKPGATSEWFDVSFNVFRGGLAIAQSYAYELKRSPYDGDSRPALVPVQSAWLKAPGTSSLRLGENLEQRETLFYRMTIDDALALFQALAAGEAISVGIKRWDQRAATVYEGKPALSDEARVEIGACLGRLLQ